MEKTQNIYSQDCGESSGVVNLVLQSLWEMMFCIFFKLIIHNTQLAEKSMKEQPKIFTHQIPSGKNK